MYKIIYILLGAGSAHLDFLGAMVAEHTTKPGSRLEFETPNYAIKSTPLREWRLVTGEEKDLPEQVSKLRSVFDGLSLVPAVSFAFAGAGSKV
jgi:hypothetical protein